MDRKGGPMSNPHTFFGQVGLFGGLIFRHIQLELPINGWLYLSLAGQISRFRQTHNTRYPKIWWISWSQFSPIYIAITWGSPPFSASCNGSRGQRSRPPASHRPRHAPCSCSRLKPPKATKLQRTQTWRRRRRNKWRSVFLWVWIYSFWISMEPWWYVFNGLARGFLQIFPSSKSGDMGMDIQIYDVRDMDIDAIRHCTYTKNGIRATKKQCIYINIRAFWNDWCWLLKTTTLPKINIDPAKQGFGRLVSTQNWLFSASIWIWGGYCSYRSSPKQGGSTRSPWASLLDPRAWDWPHCLDRSKLSRSPLPRHLRHFGSGDHGDFPTFPAIFHH